MVSISFGGKTITRPGAFAIVDTTKMTPKSLGGLKRLAFVGPIGTGDGTSVPGKVTYFTDDAAALVSLGACELLDVMKTAWRHGADLIAVSPAQITGPATAPSDTEWQSAIDLLKKENIDGIVLISTTATIQAKVDTHVVAMSDVRNRKRRRAFYGHPTAKTSTQVTALAAAIPTDRGLMASPCPLRTNTDGSKTALPSYYTAAAVAGTWASQPDHEPVTYKYLKFDGLEVIYDNATEIPELLAAHVCAVELVLGEGFRIVQGLTLSVSPDLTKQELSVATLGDTMSSEIEKFFEKTYVGQAGVAGIEVTMYNDLVSLIERFKTKGWISGYLPESVKIVKNGTAFYSEWEGQPTLPINNFLCTSHYTL